MWSIAGVESWQPVQALTIGLVTSVVGDASVLRPVVVLNEKPVP